MSVLTKQFPSVLKLANVKPIHKKYKKLIMQIIDQDSFYLILKRSLKNSRIKEILILFSRDQQSDILITIWFSTKILYYHGLISFTESIKQTVDEHRFGCHIFVELQKAFDTVDYKILLQKLEGYEIHGVYIDWFKSYLSDGKQFASINRYNSNMMLRNFVVYHCGLFLDQLST